MGKPHIAVLGTGIMGSASALFLARSGAHVTMFDAASEPYSAASRWNEGKIHLGHLYAADPTLDTAARLLPGALAFKRLTEELVGRPIDDLATSEDEIYLIHRDSVVGAEEFAVHANRVAEMAAAQARPEDYFVDLTSTRPHRLAASEVAKCFDTSQITAAFRIPERSVETGPLADAFVEALAAERDIDIVLGTTVDGVVPAEDSLDGPLLVEVEGGAPVGPFDRVVNALWEGRIAIDARLGIRPEAQWTHRYRLAMFATTAVPVDLSSAVIAVGPFGDIKAYGPNHFYLSWYPAGLVVEGTGIQPPPIPPISEQEERDIARETLTALGAVIPSVAAVGAATTQVAVRGGWVYAIGSGRLDRRDSTLHRRDRIAVHRRGSYLSVDTGKFSIAPWLARRVADALLGD